MFIVKKLVSAFLLPLPICLTLLAVGLGLLWFTRRQRAGKVLVTVATGLLTVLSFGFVGELALKPLERHRPLLVPGFPSPLDPRARNARWIVVLGGGHGTAPGVPPTSQLGPGTLARLVEAVRLKKQIPAARLVFSGGFGGKVVHADVVAAAAELLGIRRDDMVLERQTFDTVDEARFIGKIVGKDELVLVTSASHLPRALGLFRKEGMDPLPSSSDFDTLDAPLTVGSFFPGAGALGAVEYAIHESLGILFARLRGQI
jgi:uncharacterized SAM-binding protein YcdF (DUF218 family)